MKKFLKTILFLCAITSLAYAEEATTVATSSSEMSAEEQKDAMDILDRMREKIEKEEAEKAKLAAEARELGIKPGDVKSTEEGVLVVSHGMTLMTLLGRWIGVEIFSMAPMANCSVTTVELDPDRPREPTLVSWAVDPGDQGVTFETRDMADAFAGVVPVPIDWSHPQELV